LNIASVLNIKFKRIELKSHEKCDDEFEEMYKAAFDKKMLLGQYKQRLLYLEDNIKTFRNRKQWFGILESDKKFSKMIFLNKKERNIRIVFYVLEKNPTVVFLLHAFEEKSGKDGKDIGYKNAAHTAEIRLREVLAEYGKTK